MIVRYSRATFTGGHFLFAFFRPFFVEHIAMNLCCFGVFEGITGYPNT